MIVAIKKIPRSRLTVVCLLAFLIGIAAANFLSLPILWLAGASGTGFLIALFGRKWPFVLFAGIFILGISLGWLRLELNKHEISPDTLDYYNDQEIKITLTGIVGEEPDRRADHAKLILEVTQLELGTETRQINGRVLIKVARLPEYFYGDRLKVVGQLETPFETEEFSYRDYLARYDIYSVMYRPRVRYLDGDHGNLFFAKLYRFKQAFENKINQVFPEPQASFEAGLLVGSRRGIPPKILEAFNITGLTHIIAISGYNIALVIAFVTGIFSTRVARHWQFPLVALFVITFTLFVGAGPAVVRSALMGLLAFYALTEGRQYDVTLGILFTAVVMVAWNPPILLTDVSFQLSFAAVLGLVYVAPVLEKWAQKIPNKFAIRESLLMTMSAQITAVPLIIFYFDRLSLVSPLANMLVAPAIPLAMLTGFIAVAVGTVFLPAGILLGIVAHGLLSYILWIAEKFAKLPLASIEISWFGPALAVVYYIILIWRLARWHRKNKPEITKIAKSA